MTYDEKIDFLSTIMHKKTLDLIVGSLSEHNKAYRSSLLKLMCQFLPYLMERSTENDNAIERKVYLICSHICQAHTYSTAHARLMQLDVALGQASKLGLIKTTDSLKIKIYSEEEYFNYRKTLIPHEIKRKLSTSPRAGDVFLNVLKKCCTKEIAQRLVEHISSKKNPKHHRLPLSEFLPQIHSSSEHWYNNPDLIRGELSAFRDSLLDKYQRNTAYGLFQNLKNSFRVLIEHNLLPNETELPGNMKRGVATQRIRANNPIISKIDIYTNLPRRPHKNSHDFLDNLQKDISKNLSGLVSSAQKVVHGEYEKFLKKDEIINLSECREFLPHPHHLLKDNPGGKKRNGVSPFNPIRPLYFENTIAALDFYFDRLLVNTPLPKVPYLKKKPEHLPYLGLTSKTASAMQIIITEELGINPYSLYRVKINSDNRGKEYVQVTNEGTVRLRALKPRARKIQTKEAYGSLDELNRLAPHEIDAAACLRMALEMTAKIRKILSRNELWLCLTKDGATLPTPEAFQYQFNKICVEARLSHPSLPDATLKKIRTSKAILLYISSRGDVLKTASYLGNSVKTTLDRYIPPQLTELIYRVKIRSFQNMLLILASDADNEKSIAKALGISSERLENMAEALFNNPDMGGVLFDSMSKKEKGTEDEKKVYFKVSEKNIAIALKYAKKGKDDELKEKCQTAIAKISEGSILFKQMLRKAHIAIQEEPKGEQK
ncbi:hypothetical protein [Halomonas sp.]|uniref:Uncharacterized protein n=2 Tax=Halomonas ventosae TaxID=229007 RepID=A0A4R6H7G5_9GAMM|nr:hypothetical protein DFO68_11515 [Halomonas ventosae]